MLFFTAAKLLMLLMLLLAALLPFVDASSVRKLKIMPLGDSLSICCHKCSVPSSSITSKGRVEPISAWDGYIKKLWKALAEQRDIINNNNKEENRSGFDFEFVGRVRTCMINSSRETRVRTDDWEVRYEGYYGYSTSRVLTEVLQPALSTSDPDVVILILGTNDLIQAKIGSVPGSPGGGSRVQRAARNLKSIIQQILCVGGDEPLRHQSCPSNRTFSRHVVVGMIPPIYFSAIRAAPPTTRKPHRVRQLNDAIATFVTNFNRADQQQRQQQQHQQRHQDESATTPRPPPRLHLVDLFSNFSMLDDLHGDGLHPNNAGEEKMAQRIFATLMSEILDDPVRKVFSIRGGGGSGLAMAQPVIRLEQDDDQRVIVPMLDEMLLPDDVAANNHLVSASVFTDSTLLLCVVLTLVAWAVLICYSRRRNAGRMKREV